MIPTLRLLLFSCIARAFTHNLPFNALPLKQDAKTPDSLARQRELARHELTALARELRGVRGLVVGGRHALRVINAKVCTTAGSEQGLFALHGWQAMVGMVWPEGINLNINSKIHSISPPKRLRLR